MDQHEHLTKLAKLIIAAWEHQIHPVSMRTIMDSAFGEEDVAKAKEIADGMMADGIRSA